MSRREKQAARLAALESELRSRLIEALEHVARGENTIFFTTAEFNPCRLRGHMLSPETAELSDLASEALALAARLENLGGAPTATILRRYLARANDLTDPHRPGAARLAREMLDELGRSTS